MTFREFSGLSATQQMWHLVGATEKKRAVGPIRTVLADDGPELLADVPCSSVIFTNTTGVAMQIRRGATGDAITIPDQSGMEIDVVANAIELTAQSADSNAYSLTYQCVGETV